MDTHAGAVQALAAIATLFLTLVLVGATLWYAKSAKDQTSELRIARTAAVAPYVRLSAVDIAHHPPPADPAEDAWGQFPGTPYLQLSLKLENLGTGPAVRVRFQPRGLPAGVALQGVGNFAPNIPGGGGTGSLEALVSESHYARVMAAFPLSLPSELRYTDLLERTFVTRFRLHLLRSEETGEIEARVDDRMEWVFDSAESTRNL